MRPEIIAGKNTLAKGLRCARKNKNELTINTAV
jgi:hypothetical protein